MALTEPAVSSSDIERAERTLDGLVRETPMLAAGEVSRRVGSRVWLNCLLYTSPSPRDRS